MFATLMYHIISNKITDKIAVAEDAFAAQLRYLSNNGYSILSMNQVVNMIRGSEVVPARSILITFDDGYSDNVYTALPHLQRFGMTAALFMISAFVGQTNRWNPRACYDSNHLTWEELQVWLDAGCELGGHTHTHLCMNRLNELEMRETVSLNKRVLEERLHVQLHAFSYPYGRYNVLAKTIVREYYDIAFCVDEGYWDPKMDGYAINRLGVSPKWDINEFAERLNNLFSQFEVNVPRATG